MSKLFIPDMSNVLNILQPAQDKFPAAEHKAGIDYPELTDQEYLVSPQWNMGKFL
jgi:hypothetical protein